MAYSEDQATHVHMCALRPGMRLTPLQSPPSRVSEAEINHVIARTLAENRQIEARAAFPVIAGQDELNGLAGRNARRDAMQEDAAAARMREVAARHAPARHRAPRLDDLPRPSLAARRWLLRGAALLGVGAIWVLAPWVLGLVILAVIFGAAALPVAMGTERVADILARRYRRRHARDPDGAERFRARVDRLATGMDAVLDRLPERWTAGLYMPDFSREALLEDTDEGRPDPFERIAAELRRV